MRPSDDQLLHEASTELDDPDLKAAITALPSPTPSRDLVSAAMAEASHRPIEWPRILRAAAAATILVGAAILLQQRTLTKDGEPRIVPQTQVLQAEETLALPPQILTTRRHLASAKRRLFPVTISRQGSDTMDLDTRLRQAHRRLRAIRRRNPDQEEKSTHINNGAMRQEGTRDETHDVDHRMFAARSGGRTVHPRG